MHVIKDAFKVLTWCGVWRPLSFKSKEQTTLYNIFTFASILALNLLLLLQLSTICFGGLSTDESIELFYSLLSMIVDISRGLNFVLNRERIVELANMLRTSSCQAKNDNETNVKCTTDALIRQITLVLNVIVFITAIGFVGKIFLMSNDEYVLPDGTLPPYDIQSPRNFWLTYTFQSITYISSGFIYMNETCIVSGFLLYACAQFDILTLRLQELTDTVKRAGPEFCSTQAQQMAVKNIIRHHLHVVEYSKKIAEAFYWTMIVQLVIVSIIISLIISSLVTRHSGAMEICVSLCYLTCVTAGFFCYCWLGNEVSLKSQNFADSIYKTDWLLLNRESKKMLLIVMEQSSIPLTLSCGPFVTLDINSYKGILKLSYSAFNFLRDST